MEIIPSLATHQGVSVSSAAQRIRAVLTQESVDPVLTVEFVVALAAAQRVPISATPEEVTFPATVQRIRAAVARVASS